VRGLSAPRIRLVGTFFSVVGEEPLITIVVECGDDELWSRLLGSPFRVWWNRFVKVLGLGYDFDPSFTPGIMINSADVARGMITWLRRVIEKKRYSIQYIRLTKDGATNVVATIPTGDTGLFESMLEDLRGLVEEK